MLEALWVRSRKAPKAWPCWDEAMPLPAPRVSGGSEVVQPFLLH